jgi:hypothetical protein
LVKKTKQTNNKKKVKTKECSCPSIDHKKYELKHFKWDKKYFYRVKLPIFSKNPNKILKCIHKNGIDEIKAKGYKFNEKKHMILHECNKWFKKGDILIEIEKPEIKTKDKKIKIFDNKHIYSKAHVGHLNNLHQSYSELGIHITKKKQKIKDVYFWYTSCPHCTNKIEDFKTIIFIEVK